MNSIQKFNKLFSKQKEITVWYDNVKKGLYTFEKYAIDTYFTDLKGKLLVVGSGPGREMSALNKIGYNITGIDYSYNILKSNELLKKYKVINCNATNLCFKKEYFDYAVLFEQVFSFIIGKDNRIQTIKNLSYIIRDNGYVAMVLHNATGCLKFKLY